LAGIDTDPTVTEPATTAPVTDELKVTASSNIFPTATKTFNKEEGTITVSYKLTSSMDVVDTQWKLTYDNTKLEYKASDNMSGGVQTITPSAGNKLVYRNVNNYIKGNFSTLNLVPFETNADFVSVTFNIIGTGEAEIYLDLEILSLGYVDSSDNFNHASIVDYSQMQDISGIKGFENASISTLTTLDSNISIMLGDVNGDGYVKIDDVTLILKYAVSMQSLNALQIKAADVDMDGIVNVRDATLIQKYINEIITAF
ncbi:MAG: dockerin type I repeat-containing protein, partial [Ruminococcus sp.]